MYPGTVHLRESLLLFATTVSCVALALGQSVPPPVKPPAFDVATIKPSAPGGGGMVGFLSYPGGRIVLGHSSVKAMVYYAYDIPVSRITGGPDWAGKDLYEVTAVPPDTSASRTARQPARKAIPSEEQRQMLRALLADRFGLKVHSSITQGPVYLLTLGSKKLQLQDPADKDADARFAVMVKPGGIVDGETFGQNVSTVLLAKLLSATLDLPVINETGLIGFYDFHLAPDDPENHDYPTAVFDAMERLGLKLKRGTGRIETLVIDHVERPSEN
jgi:uncharacterized protein (TIGR03435 family)